MATRHALEPIDRISEILFGLIMVLTFTGSLSAATAGSAEIRTMLLGAIGCNLAWALIDAVFYLMGCLSDRGAAVRTFMAMRSTAQPDELREALSQSVPPIVTRVISDAELQRMHDVIRQFPHPPERAALRREDWFGALSIAGLVFASTFPVVLPFLFFEDTFWALRLSNAIAVAMMFALGAAFGRLSGRGPVLTGAGMVLLGALLVAIAIALGG